MLAQKHNIQIGMKFSKQRLELGAENKLDIFLKTMIMNTVTVEMEAVNKFAHFLEPLRDILKEEDPQTTEQLNQFPDLFKAVIERTVNTNELNFLNLYKLASAIRETEIDDYYKRQLVSMIFWLFENYFNEIYNKYSTEVVLLFLEVIKDYSISIDLLGKLFITDQAKLPYHDFIEINAILIDRFMDVVYDPSDYISRLELERILIHYDYFRPSREVNADTDFPSLNSLYSSVLYENDLIEGTWEVNPEIIHDFTRCVRSTLLEIDQSTGKLQDERAIKECEILYGKTLELLSRSECEALNEYLNSILRFCESHFILLLSSSAIIKASSDFLKWLLDEAGKEYNNKDDSIERILLLFNELHNLPGILEAAGDLLKPSIYQENTVVSLIKLSHFYKSRDVPSVHQMAEVNRNDDEFGRRYVMLLYKDGNFQEVLDYCLKRSKESFKTDYLGIDKWFKWMPGIGRYEHYTYRTWFCEKIIDSYTALNLTKEAIDFVTQTFLDRGIKGHYDRPFRVGCFVQLWEWLQPEERDTFFKGIIFHAEKIHMNDIEDICAYSGNWREFIFTFKIKGNVLSDINACFSKHKDKLLEFSDDLRANYRSAIETYISINSGNDDRLSTTKSSLKNLILMPEAESEVLELLLNAKRIYPKRKKLQNMIKLFLDENCLNENFLVLEKEQMNSNLFIDAGRRKSEAIWENKADELILGFRNDMNFGVIVKKWPSNINVLAIERQNELIELYKESVIRYIDKTKDSLIVRFERTTDSFKTLKASGIEEEPFQLIVFEIILKIKIRFRLKTGLHSLFEGYLASNRYQESFYQYNVNFMQILDENSGYVKSARNGFWANPELSEDMLIKMESNRHIHEIIKNWPDNLSELSENHRNRLLHTCHNAVIKLADSRKYNLSEKSEKIRNSFDTIEKSIDDSTLYNELIFSVAAGIKEAYPLKTDLIILINDLVELKRKPEKG
jgi:hypothetical protein